MNSGCVDPIYHIYSNRSQPQIEADSNTSRNFKASPSDMNDPFFNISSKLSHLGQY